MRQVLFTIPVSAPLALVVLAATLAWSIWILLRHPGHGKSDTFVDALRRAGLAAISLGTLGGASRGKDGSAPDISASGTLGTIAIGLFAYTLVKEPVSLPVFGYATAAFMGFAMGCVIAYVLAPRLGVDPNLAPTVAFLCAFFGVLGSRVFYVVEFWESDFANVPARVVFSRLDTAPGDELVAATTRGEGTVRFSGEKSLPEIVARLRELAKAGVTAELIQEPFKEGANLRMVDRGFAIESADRGSKAFLKLSGTAIRSFPNVANVPITGEDRSWLNLIAVWRGGLVFYGGMLFGTAAVLVYVKMRGIRPILVGDLASSVGGIGVAWGRVGCFLNGCCFGQDAPAGAWYAIRFPPFSPAWMRHANAVLPADPWTSKLSEGMTDDLRRALADAGAAHLCTASGPVHAVQLYAIVLDVLVGLTIIAFVRRFVKREGQTFFLWFTLYAVIRFIIEHFRGDHWGFGTVLGYALTPSQRVALAVFPFALAGLIWTTKRGRPIVPWTPTPAA